ncbi:uncharacterized protein LOC128860339 isoform X2 [Anastrepha ludens]|uniref:uncharacterized protein LOC128860339 isoform X2 n=1 Tax=Anastrepha ludens TaxID=28586 RepID=UPI0023AEC06F|nr:uncharacterized protein LOC128860339 isoform X2 [Anastrepha ludens]
MKKMDPEDIRKMPEDEADSTSDSEDFSRANSDNFLPSDCTTSSDSEDSVDEENEDADEGFLPSGVLSFNSDNDDTESAIDDVASNLGASKMCIIWKTEFKCTSTGLLYAKWQDTKKILVLSNCHDPSVTNVKYNFIGRSWEDQMSGLYERHKLPNARQYTFLLKVLYDVVVSYQLQFSRNSDSH